MRSRREGSRRGGAAITGTECTAAGGQAQHLGGREQRIALLRVVVEEELEPGELHGLRLHVVVIRIELEPGRSPAVHVHHDLHVRREPDLRRVRHHLAREPVHDEDLRRQILRPHDLVEEVDRPVDVLGVERADLASRARAPDGAIENSGSIARCTSGFSRKGRSRGSSACTVLLPTCTSMKNSAVARLRPRVDLVHERVAHPAGDTARSCPGAPCATVTIRCSAGTTGCDGSAFAHRATSLSSMASICSFGYSPSTPIFFESGLP